MRANRRGGWRLSVVGTTLLQTRQMLARRASRDVSAGFLPSYAGGYAIWLTYGLSTAASPSSSWTPSACSAPG